MCGRYAASRDQATLVEEFEATPTAEPLEADYNVAPTKKVNAVMVRVRDGVPRRELAVVRWGLVPSWAKDPSIGSRMINARAESVAEKPAYKRAFAKRRCLVPADGFYEWQELAQASGVGSGRKVKQPYFMHPADGSVMAMAGIYEFWHDKTRPAEDPEAWLTTLAVITTEATDGVGRIHDRMPLVVPKAAWSDWLDPEASTRMDLIGGLAVPATELRLDIRAVSRAVNSVRNNGPELVAPIVLGPDGNPLDA